MHGERWPSHPAQGYWAARWQTAPQPVTPTGTASVDAALDGLPSIDNHTGLRSRVADISHNTLWGSAVEQLRPTTDPSEVPAALDDLVDAAVARYRLWAEGSPIMLVHAATAPRAASLVVPHLPRELWIPTYNHAWIASATISSAYRPAHPKQLPHPDDALDQHDVVDKVVATADEHAIKFTEVALESYRRTGPHALASANRAATLIGSH